MREGEQQDARKEKGTMITKERSGGGDEEEEDGMDEDEDDEVEVEVGGWAAGAVEPVPPTSCALTSAAGGGAGGTVETTPPSPSELAPKVS